MVPRNYEFYKKYNHGYTENVEYKKFKKPYAHIIQNNFELDNNFRFKILGLR